MPPSPGSLPESLRAGDPPSLPRLTKLWALISATRILILLGCSLSSSTVSVSACAGHIVGIPVPVPLRKEEGEAREPTLGCPLSVHKRLTSSCYKWPELYGWVSCAWLDPLLGPDSLTLPSLLAHCLVLHSMPLLDSVWGRDLGGQPLTNEFFLPSRAGIDLAVPALFFPDTQCWPLPSLPPSACCPWAPGLCLSAPACPLLASQCPHSCNPVTTIGDITHSWPGSQWCKKEQNVPGPRLAPSFTWAPPWPGQGRGDGEESGGKRINQEGETEGASC